MEKFEKLDNEQKELVKYWIDRFQKESSFIYPQFTEKYLTPEPVIEVGLWWKFEEREYSEFKKLLIFVTGFHNNGKPKGYGFNVYGNWIEDDDNYWCVDGLKPIKATPKEVEQRLIEEAKSKGLSQGNSIISTSGEVFRNILGCWAYNSERNKLYYGGAEIFDNGKWAEIIDEKAEIRETIAKLRTKLSTLEAQL